MNDWSDEETDYPLYADRRNFYKARRSRSKQAKCCSLDLYARIHWRQLAETILVGAE